MVQQLIHSLKYNRREEIGTAFGEWQAAELKQMNIAKTFDQVIPVPLHKKRQQERGYNQVTFYGQALADGLAIDYNPSLLKRMVYSKSQVNKSLTGRTQVGEKLFEASYTTADHNKHFLVVDDVLTTGATLEACCNALLEIPGTRVSIACIALTH